MVDRLEQLYSSVLTDTIDAKNKLYFHYRDFSAKLSPFGLLVCQYFLSHCGREGNIIEAKKIYDVDYNDCTHRQSLSV